MKINLHYMCRNCAWLAIWVHGHSIEAEPCPDCGLLGTWEALPARPADPIRNGNLTPDEEALIPWRAFTEALYAPALVEYVCQAWRAKHPDCKATWDHCQLAGGLGRPEILFTFGFRSSSREWIGTFRLPYLAEVSYVDTMLDHTWKRVAAEALELEGAAMRERGRRQR